MSFKGIGSTLRVVKCVAPTCLSPSAFSPEFSSDLAAAMGTPCVAIFSSRDLPGMWYPYGSQHTVLRREVECSGCMLNDCVKQKMKCIRAISVDEVHSACMKYLRPTH